MACRLRLAACGVGIVSRSLLGSVSRLELGGDSQGRRANWSCMVCAIDVRHGSPPQSMPALLSLLTINNRYREASIKISVDCTPLLVSMRKRKQRCALLFCRPFALQCKRPECHLSSNRCPSLHTAPLSSTSQQHLSITLLRGTSTRHFCAALRSGILRSDLTHHQKSRASPAFNCTS